MNNQKEYKLFLDASCFLDTPELLREQAQKDGYLFLPKLINPKIITDLRRQILEICNKHGYLTGEAPLIKGLVKENVRVIESHKTEWKNLYRDILRLKDFYSLAMNEKIFGVMKILFQETVLAHCKNICRLFSPMHSEYATPPHRDYTWTGGTEDTWSVWIPLGDTPRELGGLLILPGSHQQEFHLRGGDERRGLITSEDSLWYTAESFACGDVVMFHSKTVHAAGGNYTKNQLRLSVDFRYQPLSKPIRYDALLPHWEGFGLSWDDIYSGWPENDPLKYYWKKLMPTIDTETPGTYKQDIRTRYVQNMMRL